MYCMVDGTLSGLSKEKGQYRKSKFTCDKLHANRAIFIIFFHAEIRFVKCEALRWFQVPVPYPPLNGPKPT